MSRLDWVRVTPPLGVDWEGERAFLQAIRDEGGRESVALISVGPRGELRQALWSDLRIPPGTNGPWYE